MAETHSHVTNYIKQYLGLKPKYPGKDGNQIFTYNIGVLLVNSIYQLTVILSEITMLHHAHPALVKIGPVLILIVC